MSPVLALRAQRLRICARAWQQAHSKAVGLWGDASGLGFEARGKST